MKKKIINETWREKYNYNKKKKNKKKLNKNK